MSENIDYEEKWRMEARTAMLKEQANLIREEGARAAVERSSDLPIRETFSRVLGCFRWLAGKQLLVHVTWAIVVVKVTYIIIVLGWRAQL